MKYSLFFAFIFTMNYSLNCQEGNFNKDFTLGGSIWFSNTTNSRYGPPSAGVTSSNLLINPNSNFYNKIFESDFYLGRILKEKSLLALQFAYGYARLSLERDIDNSEYYKSISSEKVLSIFYRYAINTKAKFNVCITPYFQYGVFVRKEYDETIFSEERQSNFIETGFRIGAIYTLNSHLRATCSVGSIYYFKGKSKIIGEKESVNYHGFINNLNLTRIGIGIELLL